jgi:putative DNA primase/helicase
VLLDPADFPEVEPAPRPRSQAPTGPERTATGTKPGDLFNASATWADILEPLGWAHCYRNHWTRPGKPFGVSASVLDAGLYIHSSDPATAPFVCGKTYTLFGAYALVHYGGDHSAAARELRRMSQLAA